jgi:pimeloyl-ACP methyl ester carboxylesterase
VSAQALSYERWLGGGRVVPVDLRGTKRNIFVRQSGAGDRAILFLHGFPTSSWDWSKVAPVLEPHFRLYFFDFLGFGASDKPQTHRYDLCEQADLADAVAAHFGVERARLVAHDIGSSVAQELLARRAEAKLSFALEDVTLLNGGIYPDLHRPVLTQKLLRSPLGPLIARATNEKRMSAVLASVFAAEHRPKPEELAQHWQSIARNGGNRIGHRLIRYIEDRRANERRWVGALETTDLPLRFVWGMRDPVSGAHVMARLRERFGGRAELIALEDAGHYPQLEVPERVASAIGTR